MLQQLAGYRKPDLSEKRQGGVWDVLPENGGSPGPLSGAFNARNVRIVETLRVQPYGDTEFVVEDPNGYVLVFSEL